MQMINERTGQPYTSPAAITRRRSIQDHEIELRRARMQGINEAIDILLAGADTDAAIEKLTALRATI